MTRERKKQKKRAVILAAAAAEFKDRRFDAVTLDEVAARAGVGKGTLYLYFTNKEDLFLQMALDGVEEMVAWIGEISALNCDFRERFFLFGREVGAFIRTRSVMFRLMNQIGSEVVRKEFMKQHRKLVKAARKLLQTGMDEGVLRNDFSVADLHCLLIGPLLFRVRLNEFNRDGIEVDSILTLFWEAACRKDKTQTPKA
jgi:AcrR family transcriptional regulator